MVLTLTFKILSGLYAYISETCLLRHSPDLCTLSLLSRGVENYFCELWGTGISDAIFYFCCEMLFGDLRLDMYNHISVTLT